MLYPDLNAYADWQKRAEALRAEGFDVSVSDVLEQQATDEDRANGLDLADFLLQEPNTITAFSEMQPGQIVQFDQSQVEQLSVTTTDDYPPEWDAPHPPGATPTIKAVPCRSAAEFHKWQQQPGSRRPPYFGQMGINSLK